MSDQTELIADLQTLNQISATLNKAVDMGGALQTVLVQLVELLDLETGWVFVCDDDAQERWAGRGYTLAAHHNLPPGLALDNPEAWRKGCDCQTLCQKGELSEAYNAVRCSRLADVTAIGGDGGGLTIHASAPLRSGDEIVGILNVAAPTWEVFTPQALALLTNAGNQIGIALSRARLFDMLQEQRIHEQAALLDLSNQLLSRLDLQEMMSYLVEEVRRLLQVDATALLLPADDPDFLAFKAAVGWRSDPVTNQYRVPLGKSGSGVVMETQQPLLWAQSDKAQENRLPSMMTWLEAEGFASAAIVPLVADGRSIGTMVIDTRQPREFNEGDIRFLQLMANQAAIALEKARLHQEEIRRHRMEEELAVGRQIQLSMLPAAPPELAGWQIAAAYEAAQQVGGDFYDFFWVEATDGPRRLGIVIADVVGKGVPAALFMALSRTTIRNNALRGRSPTETLTWANRYIQEDSQADMFLTAFYATLEPENGRFTYANAGHNWPLWWQAATEELIQMMEHGPALGILDEIDPPQHNLEMAPGDALVFYTDGVTEAVNGELAEFGRERLKAAVRRAATQPTPTAPAIIAAILADVAAFTGDMTQYDDYTLVVVRREGWGKVFGQGLPCPYGRNGEIGNRGTEWYHCPMPDLHYPGPETIQRHTLPNGVTLLIYENFATESVVVDGLVRAGALAEEVATAGLANMTASLLLRGTADRSYHQIYEALESVGAELGFSSGYFTTGFTAHSLVEDLDLVLGLLAQSLQTPTFPARQVERVRQQILTGLAIRTNDTRRMAGLAFHELIYPDHPYGRSANGYMETVSALTRNQIAAYHARYFGPEGMIITIVGGIEAGAAREKVEKALGDWVHPAQSSLPAMPAAPPPNGRWTQHVTLPDKSQSDIMLGATGPLRSAPDYLDASLMNTVLGVFGMMGRIGKVVREEQGLAYYAYSRFQGGLGPSPWYVSAGVAPHQVEAAIESILGEIERIQQALVPADELADSQAYRTGSLPVGLETNEGLASILTDIEVYGLGLDYLQRFPDLIRAITPGRVQAAAQKYLSTERIGIAVAGSEAVAERTAITNEK